MITHLFLLPPRTPFSCSGTLSPINPLSTLDMNTSVESVLMEVTLIFCCRVFFTSFISSNLFIKGSSDSNFFRSAAEIIDILQPVLLLLMLISANTLTYKPVALQRCASPNLIVMNFGVMTRYVATIGSPGKMIIVKHMILLA